ncbi:MAG TPA: ribonuclease III [Elusimicrobia bacterium]|nr:ribonuclease III [Elusimicrobiota bacterium]
MQDSLESVLGHRFRRPELLEEALTHKSYAFEKNDRRHNERLEFLGDSVLAAVTAHRLFEHYPDEDEGRLSKRKAVLVSRPTLTRWAQRVRLGPHLRLGSGEESTGGRERASILANALEAVIGAVYLDAGYKAASDMVTGWLKEEVSGVDEADFKSRLQEIVQKKHKTPPEYKMVKTTGPDHDKTFAVKVQFGARVLGSGHGKSKKEAEQAAAKDALERIEKE